MHLITKRLLIRELTHQDLESFSSLLGNADVMRFSVAGPLSKDKSREFFSDRIMGHYKDFGFGLWALINLEDEKFIGIAGLLKQTIDGEEFIELGYRLDPTYWGKGFASEAASAITQYAFTHLKVDLIISIIDPKNIGSVRVAKKLGMYLWKESRFHNILVDIYAIQKVNVIPYSPNWPNLFNEEKAKLLKVFEPLKIVFKHIGSTSIPGCSAKSIIDILGVTSDILEIDAFNHLMIELGFRPLGEYGMPQRRFFHRKTGIPVNLHIFEETDPEVERHLRFCAYMRNHPEKIHEYSTLKARLAAQFPHDIQSYILGKEQFIKSLDREAAWSKPNKHPPNNLPKRSIWTLGEIARAANVNMHLHMTWFTKFISSVEIVFEPDVTVVRSKILDVTLNYVLSAHFTHKNVQERVAEITNHYRKFQLPCSWLVGEMDSPSTLSEALLAQGFVSKEKNIGMYLNTLNIPKLALTSSKPLSIQNVKNSLQLKDFSDVILAVGGSSKAFDVIYSKLPPIAYCDNSFLEIYVGYIDKMPVATGVMVTHANVAGIYCLATIPEQRKNGFGTSLMHHLLLRAKTRGYFIVTLHASSYGLSIYDKLGFKPCCEFIKYTQKK